MVCELGLEKAGMLINVALQQCLLYLDRVDLGLVFELPCDLRSRAGLRCGRGRSGGGRAVGTGPGPPVD